MAINNDKPHLWKKDVIQSVDLYNDWFINFAPQAYREKRQETVRIVESVFTNTNNLQNITIESLRENPNILSVLRMSTVPPIAQDRLVGLANISKNLVDNMEDENRLPPRMKNNKIIPQLKRIVNIIQRLLDIEILPWIQRNEAPSNDEKKRSAAIIADRLCGTLANPIIRNAQEQRQLAKIKQWLEERGFEYIPNGERATYNTLRPGTFAFHLNVPIVNEKGKSVDVSIDVIIKPKNSDPNSLPIFVEAKSAGDFTNTNKRRKEEAQKINQLRTELGEEVVYILFLCGYFGPDYLGYEAAEGIDWVWEHRIEDFISFGL